MSVWFTVIIDQEKESRSRNRSTHQVKMIGQATDINASWCGLWWIEMLKTSGQDKEGVGVCFHFSYEESLHSAVMLAPIMLRKCRFHFILSGDLYKKWDQSNGAMDPKVPKEFVSVHKEDLIHTIQHTQRGSMLSKTIGRYKDLTSHCLFMRCLSDLSPISLFIMKDESAAQCTTTSNKTTASVSTGF
uniref:Uncharacterized protein n=1 Tax=Lactuca sativa TaxID=4236 RepID=A0A9R1WVF1_LACSA|nr:hypothetical protein LSAT_V11C800389970 [Lactuca sativa]